jgi:hypothetical protein
MRRYVAAILITGALAATMSCSLDEAGAEIACENAVKDRLKSPGSADFEHITKKDNGDDTWTIRGHVDSDNPLGASMRSTYGCTVNKEGDGWRAKIDDLVAS